MPEQQPTIINGKIIRPGFYRDADGSGITYANRVASTAPSECVFCPELTQTITHTGNYFTVINTVPAYAHFDAQRVARHEMLFPNDHVISFRQLGRRALREIEEFINDYASQIQQEGNFTLQDYTRRAGNPSKSVDHLHTHLLQLSPDPVSEFSFNISSGVTALQFYELTPEQIETLKSTRTPTQ